MRVFFVAVATVLAIAGLGFAVLAAPPVADFTFWPEKPLTGQVVVFDAWASYDPDWGDYIAIYAWDFDSDKNVDVQGRLVSWQFYSPGWYWVTLTVIDGWGNFRQVGKYVEIKTPPPPPPVIVRQVVSRVNINLDCSRSPRTCIILVGAMAITFVLLAIAVIASS